MATRAPLTGAGGAPQQNSGRDAGNEKVDRILAAARTLFLDHGFGETSMDAIARHATVSKATLYAHFDSKAALFAALMVTECRRLADAIGRRALDEPDIRDALLQVAHDFNNLLCSGEGLTMYRIVVAEAPRFPELGRVFYDSGPAIMIDRIAALLHRAADRGLLDVRDPRIAAIQFISLIRGELHLTRVLGLSKASKNPADYIAASVDLFLAGYRAGRKRGHRAD
jgi:TetR/AcrR family transcriptional regulator, mexJK operon transcriptional repressor